MTKERAKYYSERSKRIVSFVLEDEELKQRLKEAADADGRTVNGWITHHILPKMLAEAEAQTKKSPRKK